MRKSALKIAASEPLTGTWLTADKPAQVRFQPCNSGICGNIVWMQGPVDPETGKAWGDKFDPDGALRPRPLIGLAILSELIVAPFRTARTVERTMEMTV